MSGPSKLDPLFVVKRAYSACLVSPKYNFDFFICHFILFAKHIENPIKNELPTILLKLMFMT